MTSLLTSVIRINSPALLVSYNLNHGKGRRAPKPLLQEEITKKLFALTKDENLLIFAQINHLQNDFITQKTSVLLKSKGLFTRGLPQTYSITFSAKLYYEYCCGRSAKLSIGNDRA